MICPSYLFVGCMFPAFAICLPLLKFYYFCNPQLKSCFYTVTLLYSLSLCNDTCLTMQPPLVSLDLHLQNRVGAGWCTNPHSSEPTIRKANNYHLCTTNQAVSMVVLCHNLTFFPGPPHHPPPSAIWLIVLPSFVLARR